MNSKAILAATAAAIAIGIVGASPAYAGDACDLNGVAQPAQTNDESLACGGLLGNVGDASTAVGFSSSAIGTAATAIGAQALTLSGGGSVAGSDYSPPTFDDGSTAVGSYSYALGANTVAIGDEAGVGDLTVEGTDFLGFGIDDGTAVGSQSRVTADGGTVLGSKASATATNSTAIGANSVADQANTVSVGRSFDQRRIVNVAAGIDAADAVNVSQLQAVTGDVSGLQTDVTDLQTGLAETDANVAVNTVGIAANAADIADLQTGLAATNTALSAMDSRVDALEAIASGLDDRFHKVKNRADVGTATAVALSGAMFLPGKTFNLTGNVGAYRGAVAGAMQLGALVSQSVALNAGVAKGFNKGGKTAVRAGFTFGW